MVLTSTPTTNQHQHHQQSNHGTSFGSTCWSSIVSLGTSIADLCCILCTVVFVPEDDLFRISTFMLIWHYIANSGDMLSGIISIIAHIEEHVLVLQQQQQQQQTQEPPKSITPMSIPQQWSSKLNDFVVWLFENSSSNENDEQQQHQQLETDKSSHYAEGELSSFSSSWSIPQCLISVLIVLCIMAASFVVIASWSQYYYYDYSNNANRGFNVVGTICSAYFLIVQVTVPIFILLIMVVCIFLLHKFFWVIVVSILLSMGLCIIITSDDFFLCYG